MVGVHLLSLGDTLRRHGRRIDDRPLFLASRVPSRDRRHRDHGRSPDDDPAKSILRRSSALRPARTAQICLTALDSALHRLLRSRRLVAAVTIAFASRSGSMVNESSYDGTSNH